MLKNKKIFSIEEPVDDKVLIEKLASHYKLKHSVQITSKKVETGDTPRYYTPKNQNYSGVSKEFTSTFSAFGHAKRLNQSNKPLAKGKLKSIFPGFTSRDSSISISGRSISPSSNKVQLKRNFYARPKTHYHRRLYSQKLPEPELVLPSRTIKVNILRKSNH